MTLASSFTTKDVINFVQSRFEELEDSEKAEEMARYLKTDMPFYGVQKSERKIINRELKKNFLPKTVDSTTQSSGLSGNFRIGKKNIPRLNMPN